MTWRARTRSLCGGLSTVPVHSVGHRLAASIAVVVDETLSVPAKGWEVGEAVRHNLLREGRHLDDVDVHVDGAGTAAATPTPATGHHG